MIKKNIKDSLAQFFFVHPTARMRVRQLERALGIHLPSVIRYCRELENEGILAAVVVGEVRFYAANRAGNQYLLEKRLHNIRRLFESGLVDYLRKELSNPPMVLFGSFAKGEDVEQSDIDIYVETSYRKRLALKRFRGILKREIQLFRHRSIHEVENPHLANNIVNGITLNREVLVFR